MSYEPGHDVSGEGEQAIQLSFGLRLGDAGRIVDREADEAVGFSNSLARIASGPQVWLTAKAPATSFIVQALRREHNPSPAEARSEGLVGQEVPPLGLARLG